MRRGQPERSTSDSSPSLTSLPNSTVKLNISQSHHNKSSSLPMAPSAATATAPYLFPLLPVLKSTVQRIHAVASELTPLAPDAHLDDLQRRVIHLADTLHDHCHLENKTVLPTLRAFAPPPQKRPRLTDSQNLTSKRSKPSDNNRLIDFQDHPCLQNAFVAVKNALAHLRTAPLLQTDPTSPNIIRRVRDDPAVPELSRCPTQTQSISYQNITQPSNSTSLSRSSLLTTLLQATHSLEETVSNHLNNLEEEALPIFTRHLSPTDRGNLILQTTLAAIEYVHLSDAFRFVSLADLSALCSYLVQYAEENDLKCIAKAFVKVVSADTWKILCTKHPIFCGMVHQKHDSFVEIFQIQKAISKELKDIRASCESIDVSDPKQVQSLSTRFEFIRTVHRCHVEGEEIVLAKELQSKVRDSPCSSIGTDGYEENDDDARLFSRFTELLDDIQKSVLEATQNNEECLSQKKQKLVGAVHQVTDHMIKHMQEDETNVLSLPRKQFSARDQDQMMKVCIEKFPPEFTSKVVPWIFNSLDVDGKEIMLRNVLRTYPSEQICKILETIADSVRKGVTDRTIWNEICLRLPEIEEQYQSYVDVDKDDNIGPVSEILRVHKAFRIELNDLLHRSQQIAVDGSIPDPHYLRSLAESVAFLRKMVDDHSHAEDSILLPRLEANAPGIVAKYKEEHCDEKKFFQDLARCLEDLQCVDEAEECIKLVKKLQVCARILRDEMELHLTQEEEQIWPLLTRCLTREQQAEIVSLIFGHMSSSRLQELLPWMIRMLSVSERNTMMNHILSVTQSTMFEKWLKTWLPLDEETPNQPCAGSDDDNEGKETVSTKKKTNIECGSQSPKLPDPTSDVASTARLFLQGRENIERTIRALARDSSLSVKDRTRMMQQVMLAPYSQARANASTARTKPSEGSDDLTPTYVTGKDGVKRLGCRHYLRGVKVRAACCGKLFTCRLCHDDAVETHIMDRFATKEILCMYCQTLQPVSAKCKNKECGKVFARYFCKVCKFYDDDPNRNIYHCHSCNVCRAGKGLGIDFFHCMKCNQCMNMEKYFKRGHVCIEKSLESDCPVCHQYLFTSTSPVKYLRCGHLMHMKCFKRYVKDRYTCPLCSKSLEEVQQNFKEIDRQLMNSVMPREYRFARCDILCLDCNSRSNTPYHFFYNKCPKCSSYNTRIESVDANADDFHTTDRRS